MHIKIDLCIENFLNLVNKYGISKRSGNYDYYYFKMKCMKCEMILRTCKVRSSCRLQVYMLSYNNFTFVLRYTIIISKLYQKLCPNYVL